MVVGAVYGATQDVLGIWMRRKGGQMCGGARHISGWGLLHGVLLRRVVGDHMDVDMDMDAHAAQHVRGVRAHWVRVSGAGNVVVGLEHAQWGL